jgi:hypothetical protein
MANNRKKFNSLAIDTVDDLIFGQCTTLSLEGEWCSRKLILHCPP